MKIIKGTEPIPVAHPVILLFGQPGICKTSLAYSAKDPLLRDYDNGAHRAGNRRDTLLVESWADVAESNDVNKLAPYATVIEDTVGRCLDLLTADIAINEPRKAPGGNLSQQGWGTLKTRFRQHVATLRSLGKDVLLIAHDKEDKDGETRIIRPDIAGGSYGEVMKVADFVGYVYMSGKDRVLDFNPTDRWVGKNPGGWAPLKVPPVGKATTFMAELFDKGREALGQVSAESAKALSVVEEWRAQIENFTNTEECTNAVGAIAKAKLAPIVEPQVKKLLMDKAKALGFVWSPQLRAFVEQPQPAEATA